MKNISKMLVIMAVFVAGIVAVGPHSAHAGFNPLDPIGLFGGSNGGFLPNPGNILPFGGNNGSNGGGYNSNFIVPLPLPNFPGNMFGVNDYRQTSYPTNYPTTITNSFNNTYTNTYPAPTYNSYPTYRNYNYNYNTYPSYNYSYPSYNYSYPSYNNYQYSYPSYYQYNNVGYYGGYSGYDGYNSYGGCSYSCY